MEVTILKHNDKFCGAYLDNGILLDAREGIGEALKECGIQPKTVLLTSMSGEPVAGLAELDGVPIGHVGVDGSCTVSQFQVGSKGDRRYGFRIKTSDGELVYAPQFERLEKSKIAGASLAILDPGDRTENGAAAGLSHKSFQARERMVANASIAQSVWTDKIDANGVSVYIKADKMDYECPEGMSEEDCNKKKAEMMADKADGPNSDYLVIEQSEGKVDKQHLRVKRNGKPDHNLMAAAKAALTSNFRGNPYAGPDKEKALAKLKALYKSEGMDWSESEKSTDLYGQINEIEEAFRDYKFALPVANRQMYPVATYDDYLIVRYCNGEYYSSEDMTYYKVPFTKSGNAYKFAEPQEWVEVHMESQFTPVEKSQFIVEKEEQDGKYKYWTSISSSDFRDTDGEVVSTMAMDFSIAVNKHRGSAGNLVWDHYDELPLGPCNSQTRVGRFLVETGEFLDTPLAQKAAAKLKSAAPGKYRISIGFKYWKGTRSEDGTYHLIDIFHRAVTDHPANAATGIEVTKSMSNKQLTPEVLKGVQDALGMTDEEMKNILSSVNTQTKEEKPGESEALKTADKPAESTTPETKPEDPIAVLTAKVDLLGQQLKEAKESSEKAAELVKSKILAALKEAPSGEVIRPTASGTEISEADRAKIAEKEAQDKMAEKNSGFDTWYHMFDSAQK